MMSGLELVLSAFQSWAPAFVTDLVQSMSFITHYDSVIQGLIDVRDVIFFLSIMGLFLFANVITVDLKKGA